VKVKDEQTADPVIHIWYILSLTVRKNANV